MIDFEEANSFVEYSGGELFGPVFKEMVSSVEFLGGALFEQVFRRILSLIEFQGVAFFGRVEGVASKVDFFLLSVQIMPQVSPHSALSIH